MGSESQLFLGRGTLELGRLQALVQRPPLFAPHDAPFWDDPHIAEQMLAAHLDPDRNAASRSHQVIDQEVEWLVSHLGLSPGQHVVDLGCGPGLYCARLAARQMNVTGIDLSPTAIGYAKRYAREHDLAIEYVCQDYRSLERVEEFDVAWIIFLDFGVLSDRDRAEVLRRVHRALKAGGRFVFDVMTPYGPIHREGVQSWSVRASGFWRPGPYLELTQEYAYPQEGVDVQQTVIVDEDGDARVYRIWNQSYTVDGITSLLAKYGFQVESVWSDLKGTPYQDDAGALGVVARKALPNG